MTLGPFTRRTIWNNWFSVLFHSSAEWPWQQPIQWWSHRLINIQAIQSRKWYTYLKEKEGNKINSTLFKRNAIQCKQSGGNAPLFTSWIGTNKKKENIPKFYIPVAPLCELRFDSGVGVPPDENKRPNLQETILLPFSYETYIWRGFTI